MSIYKDTLHLPETNFPMKANLAVKELEIQAYWKNLNLYAEISKKNRGKKPFILLDGPPYANGDIHVGHAVNKILKDIVIKSKLFTGDYDVPFVPNWDCHGLPIEHQVEKKLGRVGDKVDARTFRAACREYASTQVQRQLEDFKRLGVLADWEHHTCTMDFSYQANIIRTLADIIQNDHLVPGERPVHWCVSCGSSLAEAEVEYQDKTSSSVDVAFKVLPLEDLKNRFQLDASVRLNQAALLVWTTTLWTLPANVAIAAGADFNYLLVRFEGDDCAYVVAEEALPLLESRKGASATEILGCCLGEKLEHLVCRHPFENRISPVVLGFHVTVTAGTGFVHMAPAHGMEDYLICKKYDIAGLHLVGPEGTFHEEVGHVGGQFIFKANPIVLDVLKQRGCLFAETTISHSYPHCWRHKTPLIFRATRQWFISMEKAGLRKAALEAISGVEWIPKRGITRIQSMIEDRPDWCISRQRYWGVPLPLIMHAKTGALHPRTLEIMHHVASRVASEGVEVWFESSPKDWLEEVEADSYVLCKDTLDVWFDSGVSHRCVLEEVPGLSFPADLYLEGSDQHRGWFQTALLTSIARSFVAPYRQVLTHGYVVDGEGRKMSKSLGNVVSPQKVVEVFGADVLRLWTASVDYTSELSISDEILKRSVDVYRRLRNTVRFLLGNCHDFKREYQLPLGTMLPLDQWILAKTYRLQQSVLEHYETYQFHLVVQELHHFCSYDLGSVYLDIIKDRQYTLQQNAPARRSAQTAMYKIVQSLALLLAPIMSHTAEEIWQSIPGQEKGSVFLSSYFTDLQDLPEDALFSMADWDRLLLIREAIQPVMEKARADKIIGSSLEAGLRLYVDEQDFNILSRLGAELRFFCITSFAEIMPRVQAGEGAIFSEDGRIAIELFTNLGEKCIRCWHRRSDVGTHVQHPELCDRCIVNIEGQGEKRCLV